MPLSSRIFISCIDKCILEISSFCENFVIRKTNNPFSAIAIDQADEQNSAIIKGVGGAVGLLSETLDAVLRSWP